MLSLNWMNIKVFCRNEWIPTGRRSLDKIALALILLSLRQLNGTKRSPGSWTASRQYIFRAYRGRQYWISKQNNHVFHGHHPFWWSVLLIAWENTGWIRENERTFIQRTDPVFVSNPAYIKKLCAPFWAGRSSTSDRTPGFQPYFNQWIPFQWRFVCYRFADAAFSGIGNIKLRRRMYIPEFFRAIVQSTDISMFLCKKKLPGRCYFPGATIHCTRIRYLKYHCHPPFKRFDWSTPSGIR